MATLSPGESGLKSAATFDQIGRDGQHEAQEGKELHVFRTMTKAHIMITAGMLLLNISPLLLLLIVSHWDYRIGLGAACLLAIALLITNYVLFRFDYSLIKIHTMHVAMVVALGLLFILTFVVPKHFYMTWFHVIFHFILFVYALMGYIIKKPFTMDFAKAAYHEDVWHLPALRQAMQTACIPWIFSFGTNAVMSGLKEGFRRELHNREALRFLIGVIIPIIMLLVAIVCTVLIRRRLDKKLLAMSAAMRKAEPPFPPSKEVA